MFLSASEIALAESDPFGLWHDHYGDESLRDPVDEFGEFLREQGIRVEQELLTQRTNPIQIYLTSPSPLLLKEPWHY